MRDNSFDEAMRARALRSLPNAKGPGTRLADRYVLQNVIGHGNHSIIYGARDEISGNEIALKLIPADHLAEDFSFEEIDIHHKRLASAAHRNLAKTNRIDKEEQDLLVDMDLIFGLPLQDFISQSVLAYAPIPVEAAARILDEILAALAAAHAQDLPNLDLRPSKILLLNEPNASSAPLRIIDFGLTARATQNRKLFNSGHYLAPELIAAPHNGSAASDLYAVSTIFYELLTGVRPSGVWQPPSQVRADVTQQLDDLIKCGLSVKPSFRPESAEAYRAALRRCLGSAPRPGALGSLSRWISKWR